MSSRFFFFYVGDAFFLNGRALNGQLVHELTVNARAVARSPRNVYCFDLFDSVLVVFSSITDASESVLR